MRRWPLLFLLCSGCFLFFPITPRISRATQCPEENLTVERVKFPHYEASCSAAGVAPEWDCEKLDNFGRVKCEPTEGRRAVAPPMTEPASAPASLATTMPQTAPITERPPASLPAALSPAVGLDPARAFQLAMTLTLFPPGIGFIYGPSAGHFYAGETGHALLMTAGRLGGALLAGAGVVRGGSGGLALTVVGSGVVSGLAIYDLLDASRAVKRALARSRPSTSPE